MATAEELLRVATDPILTIDVMSRKITIPKTISLLGVESDESVQKLKFSMPRHYNGIDLSEYDIRINYENAKGEGDVSAGADVNVTSDTITFTWIVGRFAVMYEGNVTFVVCLRKIDDNGDVVNEFNTTRTTLPVAKGLETDESAVMDANPDVITAIAVETLEQAKENGDFTPVKGVDYYTEEERDEFADLIVRDHNGAFANALKGTVSGEVIRVDDVSPIEHTVNCKVHGKNLFNINTVVDGSYGKYSVENDSVTFEYASDYGNYFPFAYWLDVRPNTDYSLSIGNHTSIANIYGYVDKVFGIQVFAKVLHGADFITFNSGNNTRILIGFYSITCYRDLSVTRETVSNIQIEEGSVATEYEPGVDPTTVTVTGCGKNLFKSAVKSKTINGVTFTVKDDGSINANGTAEKTIFLPLGPIQPKIGVRYYLSGSPKGSSLSTYMIYIHNELTTADYYDVGDGVAFTGVAGSQKIIIAIYAGTTVNNILFCPQLELGSESTDYEPYTGAAYTPSADGTVSAVSISPTMTLMTDTPGVTIEAEYSKDINSLGAAEVDQDLVEIREDISDLEKSMSDVENTLGDVDTALDGIIAIQNELIGGGA